MEEYEAVSGDASICSRPDGRPVCTRRKCYACWMVLAGLSTLLAVVAGIAGSEGAWLAISRHGGFPSPLDSPSALTPNYTVTEFHDLKTGHVIRLQICGCGADSCLSCTNDHYRSFCDFNCTLRTCTVAWADNQPAWYTPLDLKNTFTGVNEPQIGTDVHGMVALGTFCSFVALVLACILGPCGGTKCCARLRLSPRGVTLAYTAMVFASVLCASMTAGSAAVFANTLLDIVSGTIMAQNGATVSSSDVVATTFNLAAAGYWGAYPAEGYVCAVAAVIFTIIAVACMVMAGCCGWGWACCVSQRRIEGTRGLRRGLRYRYQHWRYLQGYRSGRLTMNPMAHTFATATAAPVAANGEPHAPGQNPSAAGGAYSMMMMMPGPYGPGGYPMMPDDPDAPLPPGQQPVPGGYASAYPQQPMPIKGAGQYSWPGQLPEPWAGPQQKKQDSETPIKSSIGARRTAFPTTATSGTGAAPAVSAAAPAPAAGTAAQAHADHAGRGRGGAGIDVVEQQQQQSPEPEPDGDPG